MLPRPHFRRLIYAGHLRGFISTCSPQCTIKIRTVNGAGLRYKGSLPSLAIKGRLTGFRGHEEVKRDLQNYTLEATGTVMTLTMRYSLKSPC